MLLHPINVELNLVQRTLRNALINADTLAYDYFNQTMISYICPDHIESVFYFNNLTHGNERHLRIVCTIRICSCLYFAYIDVQNSHCCAHLHVDDHIFVGKCLPLDLSACLLHGKQSSFSIKRLIQSFFSFINKV